MAKKSGCYPSDLTHKEWKRGAPLLPGPVGGPPARDQAPRGAQRDAAK